MPLRQELSSSPAETKIREIVTLHRGSPAEAQPPRPPMAPVPDERQIRAQLERILGSEAFDASLRNRAFLRYVVDQTLTGHANYIKGYSVAQEVFQRDVNFDPQLDPVVRIEARRLRRSLELYYLTAGKRDFVRIELPKGGYVPTFMFNGRDALRVDAAEIGQERHGFGRPVAELPPSIPTIIVRRFESLGDRREDCWAHGLTDELVGRLLSYEDVAVVAEGAGHGPDPHLPLAFLLTGSLLVSAGRLRTWVQLLDAANGRYLWVKPFDLAIGTGNQWALQEEVATAIADMIAGPAGALLKFFPRS